METHEADRVIIFDTTDRDAEQTPGSRLNGSQKLQVARQLDVLGADVIEAGFPASSQEDFEAVRRIAFAVRPIVCGLARALAKDINRTGEALQGAPRPRIHTFIGTSPYHVAMVGKNQEQVLKMAVEAVQLARTWCADVEFSAMDATRTDLAYLCEVVEAAISAGATTINIPDTVGYAMPEQFGALIANIRLMVPNIAAAVLSVHCHDDLGQAVANTLAAIKNGARQAECTINGLGERAGNAALEEVVMALNTRGDFFGNLFCNVNTRELLNTSRLVARLMRAPVPRAKAIVGANAFAHSSGIHQDGVLKNRQNFEIMKPEDVGVASTSIVLTARSGRHALHDRLKILGRHLSKEELDRTYELFLELADKKTEVRDEDLLAIAVDGLSAVPQRFVLRNFHAASAGMEFGDSTAVAALTIEVDGRLVSDAAIGDGPVDAIYHTLRRIIDMPLIIESYNASSVTGGQDALGEVIIAVSRNGFSTIGRGDSTDLNKAAILAYLDAANRIAYFEHIQNGHPMEGV